eukprot:Hpha_TRINITY_DN16600_c0_g5::TRINITY_DN16600_c0_g5_i1::g.180920::m.180920
MALSLGRLKDENQLLREENHELLGENDELHRKLHPFRPLLLLEAIPTTEQSARCCIVTEAFGGSTQAMVTGCTAEEELHRAVLDAESLHLLGRCRSSLSPHLHELPLRTLLE